MVIAGSRDFTDYKIAKEYIDFCISNIRKKYRIVIVSGGAKGADTFGEKYAIENGFNFEILDVTVHSEFEFFIDKKTIISSISLEFFP